MREQIANHTIQRASRQYAPPPQDDPDNDDDYTTSMPRSAIRYPLGRPYTYQQDNRRIVVHPTPPPRRFHWMVFWGLGMLCTIGVLIGASHAMAWWSDPPTR